MTISVSSASSNQAVAAAAYSTAPSRPAPAAPTTSVAPNTVDLSENTQVHLLQEQGQTPSEIAENLDITAAVVDGYLGITVPTVVPAPVQAPAQVSTPPAAATIQSAHAKSSVSAKVPK